MSLEDLVLWMPAIVIAVAVLFFLATILPGVRKGTPNVDSASMTDSEEEAIVARIDGLTGLNNWAGFYKLLDSASYEAACKAGELAIIYLDINDLKSVNDSLGHHGGDELIKAFSIRLRSVLPPHAEFARLGGDEFAVALMGKSVREAAVSAASAIVRNLDQPFTIHDREFHVTVAVGYAVAGETDLTPREIVRRADIAMYHAKDGGKRESAAYHSTMETGTLEKKQVETALRRAVEKGDLRVNYQPVVRAGDLTIVGVEALVRWTSKEFGTISPSLFVPVAEETGVIHDIGRFVFDRACQDLLRWPGVRMAINISPVQLRDSNFAEDILGTVNRYGISPQQIELELTEAVLISNPTIAKSKLAHLKNLGFILSLDDFGTGFSSIGFLRQFPFDILKIDRSLVRDVGNNSNANALVQSLVSLGDAMDLSVIAEGVENENQLKLLRLVQCEYVQGFLISRPIPAEEMTALITRDRRDRRFHVVQGQERLTAVG